MKFSGAYLEIDLAKIEYNFKVLCSKLKSTTKIIPVIKSNGYGSHAILVAKKLITLGVTRFAVASFHEAISLRNAGIKVPIMVFYPNIDNLELIVNNSLEPALYSKSLFNRAQKIISNLGLKKYPVHIKFNTGLNRLGFKYSERKFIIEKSKLIFFDIVSVYSQLGASENIKPCQYTQGQINIFEKIKKEMKEAIQPKLGFHLLNTSGIFNYPEKQYQAVRPGIGLYGFSNSPIWDKLLKPALSLKAPIIQIHEIDKGESVGYNQSWISKKKSKIAILPLGHADGISRFFGNKKIPVEVNGLMAYIVGNICMDIIMVDVSKIKCIEGDIVTIFGSSNTATIMAEKGGTISYELLSGLSQRIIRNILD